MENIAIVGNGKIGKQHALAFESCGAKVTKVFTSKDTLDFTDIDKIVVAVPEEHLLTVMRNIPEHIPTLYEKPLFDTWIQWCEFDMITSSLRKENTYIAFNRRHYNTVNRMKELITDTYYLEASFSDNYSLPNPAYRITSHWVDMIGYLIGYDKLSEFKVVSSSKYHLSLYQDNISVSFTPNSIRNHSVRLQTQRGEWEMNPLEQLSSLSMKTKETSTSTLSYSVENSVENSDTDNIKQGFRKQAQWFLANPPPEKNLGAIFLLVEKIYRHFLLYTGRLDTFVG